MSAARQTSTPPRLGVLASGSGTILAAMLEVGLPVRVMAADRPCRAVSLAEEAGVPAVVVERPSYGADFDRAAYTARLLAALEPYDLDVLAMAGFGTVLDGSFFRRYPDRVLNTHPALLPAFRGWHAVDDALAAGVKVTGCTVHLATEEVDDGPILAQEAVPVLPDDTVATLHERIKTVERRLYPATIGELVDRLAEGAAPAGVRPAAVPAKEAVGRDAGPDGRSQRVSALRDRSGEGVRR